MVPSYNLQGDILGQGFNCIVRIDMDDENGSNPRKIGAVSSFQARKSITVNRAETLGEFLPMSLDAQGVSTQISLRGFVPTKPFAKDGFQSVRGGGIYSVKSLNPDERKLVDTKLATKIPYLDLYDEKHGCVIGSSTWLIASSYSDSSQGKGYIEADVTLEGIGYDNGGDYETVT
jgi:hypothetical protein